MSKLFVTPIVLLWIIGGVLIILSAIHHAAAHSPDYKDICSMHENCFQVVNK